MLQSCLSHRAGGSFINKMVILKDDVWEVSVNSELFAAGLVLSSYNKKPHWLQRVKLQSSVFGIFHFFWGWILKAVTEIPVHPSQSSWTSVFICQDFFHAVKKKKRHLFPEDWKEGISFQCLVLKIWVCCLLFGAWNLESFPFGSDFLLQGFCAGWQQRNPHRAGREKNEKRQ